MNELAPAAALLEVEDLRVRFALPARDLVAVDGVSFRIEPGEVFGLVGESGCGKTVTCRSLIRLFGGTPPKAIDGTIRFAGRDLGALDARGWSALRGSEISMIFQDPMTSLNPTMRVGAQIAEGLQQHRGLTARQARDAAIEMLGAVGVPAAERRHHEYPHAFSGGMRQRVLIAIALACRPKLLIADEPTTALDVTVQDQILKLILKLRADLGMSVLLVTHDIGVVAQTCDRVAVMYAGKIVESGTTAQVVTRPAHPYTRALLAALPAHTRRGEPLRPIDGEPPNLAQPPAGCRFHPRCTFAVEACRAVVPPPVEVEAGHRAACLRAGEIG
jgi:peptide/nickel transport system ATP-binding protein/oligopeptide transport system ATP-binding protein